jgi:hypothetical protein
MINVGDKLNGCTVLAIAAKDHDAERALNDAPAVGLVLLTRRDEDGWWVTARVSAPDTTSWMWGDYFEPERRNDAWASFAERVTGKIR